MEIIKFESAVKAESKQNLEPLFKIAKTYDAQLICFTHINTSAITSQFDLIYSLRVVRDAGSSQERVDVKLSKCKKVFYKRQNY